jgi:hypothetical protein
MHTTTVNVTTGEVTQTPLTEAELAAIAQAKAIQDAEEAAWLASENERAAKSARDSRDTLLSECDWVVVKSLESGQPIPTEWATYRQALRDLPQQDGFPVTIVWPTKP